MADLPKGLILDTQTGLPPGLILDTQLTPEMQKQQQTDTAIQTGTDVALKNTIGVDAPEWLKNIIIGATQGARELGHGIDERTRLPIMKAADADQTKAGYQAQELAYEQLHPSGSVMDNAPIEMRGARATVKGAPYLAGGPEAGFLKTLLIQGVAGAAQPEQPGENALTSPLTSMTIGIPSYAVGAGISQALTKAGNSSAIRGLTDSLKLDKATVSDKGIYGAIQDLAAKADTFPEGSPEYIRANQARNFVSLINQKLADLKASNAPEYQLALRSDAGSRMLGNKLISDTLFQTRDQIAQEIAQKFGPINTSDLTKQLSGLVSLPKNKIALGGVTQPLNQSVRVLGNNTSQSFGSFVMQKNPELAEALNSIAGQKVDYATLAQIRSAIDKKAAQLAATNDTAAPVYAQASKQIDDFMDNYASGKGDLGSMLKTSDQEARQFYRNQVIPYSEKKLGQNIIDPAVSSAKIGKNFINHAQDDPEDAARMFRLLTPEGQQVAKIGILQQAVQAATDNKGYIDPVLLKKSFDSIPNTVNTYFKTAEDRTVLDGLNNLVSANASAFGKENTFYQRYMQAYGVENITAGEFAHGARQLTMPTFYNWMYRGIQSNPALKRFVQASAKINPNTPAGVAAAAQFSKLLNQYIVGQLAQTNIAKQPVNTLLPESQ